jgi:hypothetical protein
MYSKKKSITLTLNFTTSQNKLSFLHFKREYITYSIHVIQNSQSHVIISFEFVRYTESRKPINSVAQDILYIRIVFFI